MSVNITGYPGVAPNITFLDQCTPDLCPLDIAVMKYIPSLSANAVFVIIFAILFVLQAIMCFFYKTYTYTFAMCAGLALEIVGYLARISMRTHMFTEGPFLIQIICLTVAPVFITAALYITLSRIILHYGHHNSRLSPKAYTLTFISADIVALILQSVGGGVADNAASLDAANTGVNVMVAGLSFQLASLTLFSLLAAEFFYNVKKDRKQIRNTNWAAGKVEHPPTDVTGFKIFIGAFVAATILIIARSAFRVAELVHGFKSELANDEVAFMVFEGGVMIVATFAITLFQPGRYIGEKWKESGWGVKKSSNVIELRKYDEMETPVVHQRPWPMPQ